MGRNLLSGLDDLDVAQQFLAELHDDIRGRAGRLHQLADLSRELGLGGAMIPGGTITYRAWTEARASFINGHFVATVLLCQGMMEHLLASDMEMQLDPVSIPPKASAKMIRQRSREVGLITPDEERELELLERMRNPLTHHRKVNDPEHIDQQALQENAHSNDIIERNAVFAITLVMKILAKPSFCL